MQLDSTSTFAVWLRSNLENKMFDQSDEKVGVIIFNLCDNVLATNNLKFFREMFIEWTLDFSH